MADEELKTVLDARGKGSSTNQNLPKKHPFGKRALLSGLILAVISCICVAAVLFVQRQTSDVIAANQKARNEQMMTKLLPPDAVGSNVVYSCKLVSNNLIGRNMRLYTAQKSGKIAGYVLSYSTSRGYSNPLVLIAGFTADKKVYRTDILFSQETPGLGDKVDYKHGRFMDQLKGHGLEDKRWDVKKFGGDFDFITGSTVTSRAVVLATKDALETLDHLNIDSLPNCED